MCKIPTRNWKVIFFNIKCISLNKINKQKEQVMQDIWLYAEL